MAKYIFVTGGVISSVGKGITAASIGRLIKANGYKVTIQKLDPYLNVDPGTMSPFQHGEVFVTEDGGETDLDLGHYERFIDENLSKKSNFTAGSVYSTIVNRERVGDYLGATVQVIPHVTNEIKERITSIQKNNPSDFVIVEVGGTVGDIEGLPFLEAVRQLKKELGEGNTFYVHVTLVPFVRSSQELKTKPTQHSVKELRSIGIQPDAIVCRSEKPLNQDIRNKIALFCDVDQDAVFDMYDVETIYEVPLVLKKEKFDRKIFSKMGVKGKSNGLTEWEEMVRRIKSLQKKVKIAIVGKYVSLPDAYLSVVEALKHGGIFNNAAVEIEWVDADELSDTELNKTLAAADGILVPGGFGVRGIEGKIKAIKFARENKKPFLGICLGMQCAAIEFARNVLGFADANSREFSKRTNNPVIDLMNEQKNVSKKGGTMRLGAYPCELKPKSLAKKIYQAERIEERHRHRYEFNNSYRGLFEKNKMSLSGLSPDKELVEIIELTGHPYFIASQFHPEFKSRPTRPHPLFRAFIEASCKVNS